jgi:hypothetical protein
MLKNADLDAVALATAGTTVANRGLAIDYAILLLSTFYCSPFQGPMASTKKCAVVRHKQQGAPVASIASSSSHPTGCGKSR